MDEIKLCSKCKEEKPRTLKYFYAKNTSLDGLTSRCKSCLKTSYVEERKQYRINNKNKFAETNRNTHLLRKYNITLEQYNKLFVMQKGLCAICSKQESRKTYNKVKLLSVDHCHTTGKVRGLVCDDCNNGLGRFNDNVNLLKSAIEYLERSSNEN